MQIGQDRLTITFNVGLENNAALAPGGKPLGAQDIAEWMADFIAKRTAAGLRPDTLVGVTFAFPADGIVTELTAVVSYSAQDVTEATLRPVIDELTAVTTQGCIATLIEDDESGASVGFLTGPRSADYAPFDVGKFDIGGMNAGDWVFAMPRVLELA